MRGKSSTSPIEPDVAAALDADLAALGDRYLSDGTMDWECLLVTATRS